MTDPKQNPQANMFSNTMYKPLIFFLILYLKLFIYYS
jgi:hypothetical protein